MDPRAPTLARAKLVNNTFTMARTYSSSTLHDGKQKTLCDAIALTIKDHVFFSGRLIEGVRENAQELINHAWQHFRLSLDGQVQGQPFLYAPPTFRNLKFGVTDT